MLDYESYGKKGNVAGGGVQGLGVYRDRGYQRTPPDLVQRCGHGGAHNLSCTYAADGSWEAANTIHNVVKIAAAQNCTRRLARPGAFVEQQQRPACVNNGTLPSQHFHSG